MSSRRGFAAMSPEKQRMITSLGGKAAHVQGTAHRFTRDEAALAGRKGGASPRNSTKPRQIDPNLDPLATGIVIIEGAAGGSA